MSKMTAAKAIVEVMAREGVEKAFCVPGESYLDVMNEMYEHPNIELVTGRQEGGISFMTEGYAKASGKVGVCFATRGPGATNLSIGLHTAHQDSTPLVAFIGQLDKKFRGRGGFQEIDLAEAYGHIVKWSVELTDASRTPEIVHRAFHMARTGRPGPVLVSLPEDMLSEEAEMEFRDTGVYFNPHPSQEAIQEAKHLLQSSQKPMIIAGGGAVQRGMQKPLVELAEKLNIPVSAAFRRFDVFPNDHSHYVGPLSQNTPKDLAELVYDADVVLALGTRLSQFTTKDYSLINTQSKLIHVDVSEQEINKVYRADVGIVADAKHFVLDLLSALEDGGSDQIENTKDATDQTDATDQSERTEYVRLARQKYEQLSTSEQKNDPNYVDLEGLVHDLKTYLPKDALLTNDAGNFAAWLAKYYSFEQEGTYIGPTSGAMGYGLPAAIGAKVAQPDQTVVSFSGDGGFFMTMQELETAVRNNIVVIAIVATNNMYGTIRMHQEMRFPNRVIGTSLTNPNFAHLAEMIGAGGEVVSKNEDFAPALQRALKSEKPYVIEVLTDPLQLSISKRIDQTREKASL